MKTYTLAQIRTYLLAQDSLGDAIYFLNEENLELANEVQPEPEEDENTGKLINLKDRPRNMSALPL